MYDMRAQENELASCTKYFDLASGQGAYVGIRSQFGMRSQFDQTARFFLTFYTLLRNGPRNGRIFYSILHFYDQHQTLILSRAV